MLYERTAISKLPEETIKNDLLLLQDEDIMTVDMFYRDPCILDFLGLHDTYSEKDLENAILAELEKFILEMENEEPPIALILCAEKSDEVIELLELDKGDVRVTQYLTAMPSKEVLEEKLHLAIQRAKIQLEQRRE